MGYAVWYVTVNMPLFKSIDVLIKLALSVVRKYPILPSRTQLVLLQLVALAYPILPVCQPLAAKGIPVITAVPPVVGKLLIALI